MSEGHVYVKIAEKNILNVLNEQLLLLSISMDIDNPIEEESLILCWPHNT